MSLIDLADNTRTDKYTIHTYLGVYDDLLKHKKETALNVLEVGIDRGGSIKMWHDYFPHAVVHAVDIMPYEKVWSELKDKERIKLYTSSMLNMTRVDAYDPDWVKKTFGGIKFDFMLDDGPHTLDSMVSFLNLYLPLLAPDGVLLIEDVQDYAWFNTLKDAVSEDMGYVVKYYDMRSVKCRYDDLVFAVFRHGKMGS
jgi:hypothetical protein